MMSLFSPTPEWRGLLDRIMRTQAAYERGLHDLRGEGS